MVAWRRSNPGAVLYLALASRGTAVLYCHSLACRFCRIGNTATFKTTFEEFPGVSADHSLERFTERRIRLVTDQPGNINELFVALLE